MGKVEPSPSLSCATVSEYSSLSPAKEIGIMFANGVMMLWSWLKGPACTRALKTARWMRRRIRRNMTADRIFSFPHVLVAIWILILMRGERWVFRARVEECDWDRWEQWPPDAQPHRLILVADPQLIDPHSYPGRPWPLNSLTYMVTDNYLRRSYTNLQTLLVPDTTIFLGDLFDGGREWKTDSTLGDSSQDPPWASRYPDDERDYVAMWRRKYGDTFWRNEFRRFSKIFFNPFFDFSKSDGASKSILSSARSGQGDGSANHGRGRRLIASLPGNHDFGFGSQVGLSARRRFQAFFGDSNRVDVVGNHTIVQIDTLSLSARTSDAQKTYGDEMRRIYGPVEEFLSRVKEEKSKKEEEELRFWRGESWNDKSTRGVEILVQADNLERSMLKRLDKRQPLDQASAGSGFPTILLTHVPLYRKPGTPCGPLREHSPPTPPPPGQTTPVFPDERNALSISAGYQYQNVLMPSDSIDLIEKIGNVQQVFSGDDHDHCDVIHEMDISDGKGGTKKTLVREITVKSISMAMGVKLPGFVMVSLWNPVDVKTGRSLPSRSSSGEATDNEVKDVQVAAAETMQIHLCLLPRQFDTWLRYVTFAALTAAACLLRAFFVALFDWPPFKLDPDDDDDDGVLSQDPHRVHHQHHQHPSQHHYHGHDAIGASKKTDFLLPMYKDKPAGARTISDSADPHAFPPGPYAATSGGFQPHHPSAVATTTTTSTAAVPPSSSSSARWQSQKWPQSGPRITISRDDDDDYEDDNSDDYNNTFSTVDTGDRDALPYVGGSGSSSYGPWSGSRDRVVSSGSGTGSGTSFFSPFSYGYSSPAGYRMGGSARPMVDGRTWIGSVLSKLATAVRRMSVARFLGGRRWRWGRRRRQRRGWGWGGGYGYSGVGGRSTRARRGHVWEGRSKMALVWAECGACLLRIGWMVGGLWLWLNWTG